jgi:E2F/DP family winged-helix DNA-binding domain
VLEVSAPSFSSSLSLLFPFPSLLTLAIAFSSFLALYNRDDVHAIGLDDAARRLGVERRRIYDIVNVLESVGVTSCFFFSPPSSLSFFMLNIFTPPQTTPANNIFFLFFLLRTCLILLIVSSFLIGSCKKGKEPIFLDWVFWNSKSLERSQGPWLFSFSFANCLCFASSF